MHNTLQIFRVYSLLSFDISTHRSRQWIHKCPKMWLCSFIINLCYFSLLSKFRGNNWFACFLLKIVCFPEFYLLKKKKTYSRKSFCVWILLLSIILRFIHAVTWSIVSLFSWCRAFQSIDTLYVFTHSPVVEHVIVSTFGYYK